MALVRYFPPEGSPKLFAIHRPVTTLGRALGNDIHIPDATVHQHHAQIVFNGRDFQLEEVDRAAEIQINGKRRGEIAVAKGMPAAEVEKLVLSMDEIVRILAGQTPKKIVIVPDRIVNVVV